MNPHPDPHQIKLRIQDPTPDPHQSDKSNPDPHQSDADPHTTLAFTFLDLFPLFQGNPRGPGGSWTQL